MNVSTTWHNITAKGVPKPARKRKKYAIAACARCKKAHAACGNERPCRRCLAYNYECVEAVNKKAKKARTTPANTTTTSPIPLVATPTRSESDSYSSPNIISSYTYNGEPLASTMSPLGIGQEPIILNDGNPPQTPPLTIPQSPSWEFNLTNPQMLPRSPTLAPPVRTQNVVPPIHVRAKIVNIAKDCLSRQNNNSNDPDIEKLRTENKNLIHQNTQLQSLVSSIWSELERLREGNRDQSPSLSEQAPKIVSDLFSPKLVQPRVSVKPSALFGWDNGYPFISCNPVFLQMAGVTEHDLISGRFVKMDFFPFTHESECTNLINLFKTGKVDSAKRRLYFRSQRGEDLYVSLTLHAKPNGMLQTYKVIR